MYKNPKKCTVKNAFTLSIDRYDFQINTNIYLQNLSKVT